MRQDIELKPYLKLVYGSLFIAVGTGLNLGGIIGNALLLGGTFLMIEHIYSWEQFTLSDYIGHEYLGLGMFIVGSLVNMSFWGLIPLGVGIYLASKKGTLKNEFKLLLNKLKNKNGKK